MVGHLFTVVLGEWSGLPSEGPRQGHIFWWRNSYDSPFSGLCRDGLWNLHVSPCTVPCSAVHVPGTFSAGLTRPRDGPCVVIYGQAVAKSVAPTASSTKPASCWGDYTESEPEIRQVLGGASNLTESHCPCWAPLPQAKGKGRGSPRRGTGDQVPHGAHRGIEPRHGAGDHAPTSRGHGH